MYHYRLVYVTFILAFIISVTVNASNHQRFSNLDRLINRLDGSTELPPTSTLPTTSAPHRIRHAHWQQHLDNTFQQFDNILNNNHNHNNNNNNSNNNNNNNKNTDKPDEQPALLSSFDEDDDEEDDEVEEPQPEDLQADIRHRLPFTTSIGKTEWNSKSQKKAFDKLYNNYRHTVAVKMTGGEEDPAALEEYRDHHKRMKTETECKIPQPKVVRVSDHYPSSTKRYTPSCTKLYRCSDDTGCCEGNRKCGVKASEKVELYFYVLYDVPVLGRHSRRAVRIEKLQFYNHTECECHDRSDEMPRDIDPFKQLQPAQENSYNRCKCPSEYTVRNLANGSCSCDCFDKQRDCTKYKKGKEYFNHQDRLCIEMRTCTVPACDFGVYIRKSGRCPRKHEKYRTWPRFKP